MSLLSGQVYEIRTLEDQLNVIGEKYGEEVKRQIHERITYPSPWLAELYRKWERFVPQKRRQNGHMDTGNLVEELTNAIKANVPEYTTGGGSENTRLNEMGKVFFKAIYFKITSVIRQRRGIQAVQKGTSTDFTLDRPEGTNVSWTSALAGFLGLGGGGNIGVGQVGPMKGTVPSQPYIVTDESRTVPGQTYPLLGDTDAILGSVRLRYREVLERTGALTGGTPKEIGEILERLGEMTRTFAAGLDFPGKDPNPGTIDQKALNVAANGVVEWINKDGPHRRTARGKGNIDIVHGRLINALRGNSGASETLRALKSIKGAAIEDIGYRLFPESSEFPYKPYMGTYEMNEEDLREAGFIN